jgi:CubicO group peptidase (beta-lactamase class C family)
VHCSAANSVPNSVEWHDTDMKIPIGQPSEHGVAPEAIMAFLDALESDPKIEPHGLIIQRHGHRIAEGYWAPHTADRSRLVYSLSKTFTGTALGLQLGEGRLSLDDLVSDHLPESFTHADDRTKRMRIRHIASMATGHDREMMGEAMMADPADPVRGFFTIVPDQEPGTLFAYNQPPVLALATILQRLAGERMVDYLRPRVFDPLGIGDVRWTQHAPGFDLGFSGVHTNLDAIARLGQLYLNDGICDGRRLLPEGWVADASRVHISNAQMESIDWQQGYGLQLWMSQHGYRGDGAFGQYMVVLPEFDSVIAMFSCNEDMQRVLDLMWNHLIPAMSPNNSGQDSPADALLVSRLAHLARPTAAERLQGGPINVAPMRLLPGVFGSMGHRTITAVELFADRLVLYEGEAVPLALPLSTGWTTLDAESLAVSATTLPDGKTAVDIVLLANPHRLELILDPATSSFSATWPVMPLFVAGVEKHVSRMQAPT